jgi:hypothetical protein
MRYLPVSHWSLSNLFCMLAALQPMSLRQIVRIMKHREFCCSTNYYLSQQSLYRPPKEAGAQLAIHPECVFHFNCCAYIYFCCCSQIKVKTEKALYVEAVQSCVSCRVIDILPFSYFCLELILWLLEKGKSVGLSCASVAYFMLLISLLMFCPLFSPACVTCVSERAVRSSPELSENEWPATPPYIFSLLAWNPAYQSTVMILVLQLIPERCWSPPFSIPMLMLLLTWWKMLQSFKKLCALIVWFIVVCLLHPRIC